MAAVLLWNGPRQGADDTPSRARARDWAEIQERMLVPLYEAVHERLGVGPRTRLLGLGCGSGLALLMAACRGAAVTGADPDGERLELARQRLLPDEWQAGPTRTALVHGGPGAVERAAPPERPFNLVTLLEPWPACGTGGTGQGGTREADLAAAARLAEPGSPVVLAGPDPSGRCETAAVLRLAARLAEPRCGGKARRDAPEGSDAAEGPEEPGAAEELERPALRAGLRPQGSWRVACPFAYPDQESAVRGLLSTGWFDAAVESAGARQVDKELREVLHPFRHPDGTVRMENDFRYLVARV